MAFVVASNKALFVSCVALALTSAACNPIRTSAVSHKNVSAWRGRVMIVSSYVPEDDVEEVGIVQAKGTETKLPELVARFAEQVASIGGNIGVVDSIRTRYEWITHTETYQYSCGDSKSYRTCTGVRSVTEEVGTTTVLGRAFRK